MFRFLTNWLRGNRAAFAVPFPEDVDDFCDVFLERSWMILNKPLNDGLDPDSMTQEELLAQLEAAAAAVRKQIDGDIPIEAFVLKLESQKRDLPVFTTQKHAEAFIESYVVQVNRVIPFQILTVSGHAVASMLLSVDGMLIDPCSPGAAQLSPHLTEALRSRSRGLASAE